MIRNCPVCDKKPSVDKITDGYAVQCSTLGCPHRTKVLWYTRKGAIESWNEHCGRC